MATVNLYGNKFYLLICRKLSREFLFVIQSPCFLSSHINLWYSFHIILSLVMYLLILFFVIIFDVSVFCAVFSPYCYVILHHTNWITNKLIWTPYILLSFYLVYFGHSIKLKINNLAVVFNWNTRSWIGCKLSMVQKHELKCTQNSYFTKLQEKLFFISNTHAAHFS